MLLIPLAGVAALAGVMVVATDSPFAGRVGFIGFGIALGGFIAYWRRQRLAA